MEVLYSTKLVAVVGSGEHPSSPARRVSLINCGHGKEIYSLTFPTPVLAVRMSKNRYVIGSGTYALAPNLHSRLKIACFKKILLKLTAA